MGATAKTLLLMGVLTGILGALGYLFLGGWAGLIVFVVIAAAMNLFAYWKSDALATRMAGAHEVTPEQAPRLHRIVDEVTALSGLPKPKVYVVNNPSPNAFATGRNPKHAVVAATTGIMALLDDRELKGVMAHELGHVGNKDILIGSVAAIFADTLDQAKDGQSESIQRPPRRGEDAVERRMMLHARHARSHDHAGDVPPRGEHPAGNQRGIVGERIGSHHHGKLLQHHGERRYNVHGEPPCAKRSVVNLNASCGRLFLYVKEAST